MPTKLGFQLHDGADSASALARLAAAPPAALLVLDSPSLINAAYDAVGAGPVYAYQRYGMGDIHDYLKKFNTIDAAVRHFAEEVEPSIRALRWVYHCTFSAAQITEQSAQFEAALLQYMFDRFKVRLCIGNFLTATPNAADWARYRPTLEAAARYGGIVGLREVYPILPYVGYGPNANIPDPNTTHPRKLRNEIPYPQNYRDPGLYVGRYRHLRDYCRQQNIPVRILIGESGAGRAATQWMDSLGAGLGHWKTLAALWARFGYTDAQTHYLQDLIWLDQHVYGNDPEVIGTCVFAWNTPDAPNAEIGGAATLLNGLQGYLKAAMKDQAPGYTLYPLPADTQYTVSVTRLRVRPLPSLNTHYTGGFDYGETITATHYAFNDGNLWVKHRLGWSVYAPLVNGNPDYSEKYLEGRLITTPRQDAAVKNFVGTIDEVRQFLKAHENNLFYISINPNTPPKGARQFSITVFPPQRGRVTIDKLHPAPGDPLMTPGAKKKLRDSGQL